MSKQIVENYLESLRNNDYAAVIEFFTNNGVVIAPQHPKPLSAEEFFSGVAERLQKSNITLKAIFTESDIENQIVAHLIYERIMKDGSSVTVECLDLFEFDANDKIKKLLIICMPYKGV